MDTGYLNLDLRNRLGGHLSLISASPRTSACFPLAAHQLLYLWSARLKNGSGFWGHHLWLGGGAPTNKHGCQEVANEAMRVGEASSQKGGARDTSLDFSTVLLLQGVRQSTCDSSYSSQ